MHVTCFSGVYISILIASQQKARLHVSAHSSTRTEEEKSVIKLSIYDQSANLQLYHLHHQYIRLVTWEEHK